MLPWLVVLAGALPATASVPHWCAAWVGLDAFEAAGLVATGWLTLRGDPRRCLTAIATAALLLADAWFDVTTSASGTDWPAAVAMALCAELPMAALCVTLAVRAVPRPSGPIRRPLPSARRARGRGRSFRQPDSWGRAERVTAAVADSASHPTSDVRSTFEWPAPHRRTERSS